MSTPRKFKYHSDDRMIEAACAAAISRSETYSFRSNILSPETKNPTAKQLSRNRRQDKTYDKNYFPDKRIDIRRLTSNESWSYLSQEVKEIAEARFKEFSSEKYSSKWHNRHGTMASPLGSEIVLRCERVVSDVFVSGPQYYMDELLDANHLPDVRMRFPYSDAANHAAKVITSAIFNYILLRRQFVFTIQKWCRRYLAQKRYRVFQFQARWAARLIQQFFHMKFSVYLINKHRRLLIHRSVAIIQAWHRRWKILRIWRPLIRQRHEELSRKCNELTEKQRFRDERRSRGIHRRQEIHACRIQRFIRHFLRFRRLHHLHSKQIIIAYYWRKYFRRKYLPLMKKVCRKFLERLLYRRVVMIQQCVRMFLSKRRVQRKLAQAIARGRARSSAEQAFLAQKILHFSEESFQCDSHELTSMMKELDSRTRAILRGTVFDDEGMNSALLPRHDCIAAAILYAFAARPGGRITREALELCLDQHFISSLSTKYFIEDSVNIWPMNLLITAIIVDRPIQLVCRLRGRLPERLIFCAALYRLWILKYEAVCLAAIKEYRMNNRPQTFCPACLEAFNWHADRNQHVKACPRIAMMTWIHSSYTRPAFEALKTMIGSHPRLPAPSINQRSLSHISYMETCVNKL